MPYKKPGTWEGHPNYRWKKMVKGQMIRIRCGDDLHLPQDQWTELGSIKAASEYLEAKMAELAPEPDRPSAISVIRSAVDGLSADDLARIMEQGRMAERLITLNRQLAADHVEIGPDGTATAPLDFEQRGMDRLRQDEVAGVLLDELLSGREGRKPMAEDNRYVLAERFAEKIAPKKSEGQMGDLIQHGRDFLSLVVSKLRPKSYHEIKDVIEKLPMMEDSQGRVIPADVATIDEATVKRVYLALESSGLSQSQKKKRFSIFKRFLSYCNEMNLLDLPRNLYSSMYKFKMQAKAIAVYAPEEVRKAIDALPSRLQLYAMLTLNCGMNNVDIGSLMKSQVKGGYLTRKRVKTAENDNVPTVSYRLWPRTLELLRDHEADHATLMLTSMNNMPLWSARIEDGKSREKDLVALQWQRHRGGKSNGEEKTEKRKNCPFQLKQFRSIAATTLESHAEYGRFSSHYLGHSPKSVKDKHYAAPSQKIFDMAMGWLGKQFGF